MHVDGGCHCGAITYEAEIDPNRIGLCHCTDCQTFGGSAFRIGTMVSSEDLRVLSGTPAVYEKTADSGGKRLLLFCATCGTHLFGTPPGDEPKQYSLRVATMSQREELTPVARIWCRSSPDWLDDIASLPRVEKQAATA